MSNKLLILRLIAAHETLATAKDLGTPTRTARLHQGRCNEIMDTITEAIEAVVELDALYHPVDMEKPE